MIVAARFMAAQLVATNGCLWIALVGIEAKAETGHGHNSESNGTYHMKYDHLFTGQKQIKKAT